MGNEDILKWVSLVRESILVGALVGESIGRIMRLISGGDFKADKGLVMGVQGLYSMAYGLKDFEEKLRGVKYAKK